MGRVEPVFTLDRVIYTAAAELQRNYDIWTQGMNASPDERDAVWTVENVLMKVETIRLMTADGHEDIKPVRLTDEQMTRIADKLYELGDALDSVVKYAKWIVIEVLATTGFPASTESTVAL